MSARTRRRNAARKRGRRDAASAPESELELVFFAEGDSVPPPPDEVEDLAVELTPRLTPRQLARRAEYRRRVTQLMIPFGVLAVWAVVMRMSAGI